MTKHVWLLSLALWVSGCHLVYPFGVTAPDAGHDLDDGDRGPPGEASTTCQPSCQLGCRADGACRRYDPSNLPAGFASTACGVLALDGAQIQTTSCTISGLTCTGSLLTHGGVKLCVFAASRLTIGKSGAAAKGDRSLIFVVSGDVEISGLLDLSADAWVAGPGGFGGGKATGPKSAAPGGGPGGGKHCTCTSKDDCGGGGGGHATAGGDGAQESSGCTTSSSPGGVVNGAAALVPLIGGSGGSSGHNNNTTVITLGAGGGGGGAVQISSQGTIRVAGAVSAGGGGGRGGVSALFSSAAGGGGGAGGAILLEAARLLGSGWLAANGGGGGGGADLVAAKHGERGHPDDTVAKGGATDDVGGVGGAGATGTTPAKPGVIAEPSYDGAGSGGGGGLGRVRLNLLVGAHSVRTSAVVSEAKLSVQ